MRKPLLQLMHRAMSRDRLRSQQGVSSDSPTGSRFRRSSLPDEGGELPRTCTWEDRRSTAACLHANSDDATQGCDGARRRGGAGKEVEEDSMVLQVYVSEQRRRVLKVCDFDFGEGNDEENDYQGSEALEKKVTTMERKGQHDHAAFIRLLQVSLTVTVTVTVTVAVMVTVTVMCWHSVSCLAGSSSGFPACGGRR